MYIKKYNKYFTESIGFTSNVEFDINDLLDALVLFEDYKMNIYSSNNKHISVNDITKLYDASKDSFSLSISIDIDIYEYFKSLQNSLSSFYRILKKYGYNIEFKIETMDTKISLYISIYYYTKTKYEYVNDDLLNSLKLDLLRYIESNEYIVNYDDYVISYDFVYKLEYNLDDFQFSRTIDFICNKYNFEDFYIDTNRIEFYLKKD